MHVLTSQFPGDGRNADRVLVTDSAVLVLDGASAFEPVPLDPGEYAEALGRAVARSLSLNPDVALSDAVAYGIASTAHTFALNPGQSPSSTIAILRVRHQLADLFVLGDSPIYYGTRTTSEVLRDDRLSEIAKPERTSYIEALRAGHGYNATHRDTLAVLQRVQREFRNINGGYWIAEADPDAARHALNLTVDSSNAEWAVLGSDGAMDLVTALDPQWWSEVAAYDQRQLDELLYSIHSWENDVDPTGRWFPRAKLHDDKTLAIVPRIFGDVLPDARTGERARPVVCRLPRPPH